MACYGKLDDTKLEEILSMRVSDNVSRAVRTLRGLPVRFILEHTKDGVPCACCLLDHNFFRVESFFALRARLVRQTTLFVDGAFVCSYFCRWGAEGSSLCLLYMCVLSLCGPSGQFLFSSVPFCRVS